MQLIARIAATTSALDAWLLPVRSQADGLPVACNWAALDRRHPCRRRGKRDGVCPISDVVALGAKGRRRWRDRSRSNPPAPEVSRTSALRSGCSPAGRCLWRSSTRLVAASAWRAPDDCIGTVPIARWLAPERAAAIVAPAAGEGGGSDPGYGRVAAVSHVTHRVATSASCPIRKWSAPSITSCVVAAQPAGASRSAGGEKRVSRSAARTYLGRLSSPMTGLTVARAREPERRGTSRAREDR